MNTAAILALISTGKMIYEGGKAVFDLVRDAIKKAKERGELTPEQEAELDAAIAAAHSDPAWQADAQRGK